ncbi:MAG: transporter substrate-binding domain-containing protein, partial [Gammaproteobacteria bacterium]|nr:transporter substrate-binding domain-containing protein [Gammaproteobacteria bacterium]
MKMKNIIIISLLFILSSGISYSEQDKQKITFKFLTSDNKIDLTKSEQEFIKNHPEIVLASGESFEPFTMLNSDGSVSGYDVDVMALIKNKTGLNVKFSLGNWNEIQKKSQKREFDGLSSVIITDERKKHYNFTVPYFKYYMLAIVKKGNPQNIHKIEDLKGKRVALQTGNKAFERKAMELGQSVKFIYYDKIHDLIRSVALGKTDFTILDETAGYIAQSIGLTDSVESALILDNEPTEVVFALRNDYPELVSIINKSLRSTTRKEFFDIRRKWFGYNSGEKTESNQKISLSSDEVNYLKSKSIVKVCSNPDGMPYEQIDGNGKHDGMAKDYLSVFSNMIGIETQLYTTNTWAETLAAIKQRKCDIITLAAETPERKKYLEFTSSVITTHSSIVTTNDKKYVADLSREIDKVIALVDGAAEIEYLLKLYPKIKLT